MTLNNIGVGHELVSCYGRHVPWTRAEEEALRQYYGQLSWAALRRMLPGRTPEAIERRAGRLPLTRAAGAGGDSYARSVRFC